MKANAENVIALQMPGWWARQPLAIVTRAELIFSQITLPETMYISQSPCTPTSAKMHDLTPTLP